MGLCPGLAPRRPRRLSDSPPSADLVSKDDPDSKDRSMPLDPKRVQAVFGAAIAYDAVADRAAVLDRECSTDAELRRRVEALLAAHDQADSLLDQPTVGPD